MSVSSSWGATMVTDPKHIVAIRVYSLWETCERTTYYVELRTDEGFTMTPSGYATGSVYTNFEGLSKEEARNRALLDAITWADFLGLTVEPLMEDGVEQKPTGFVMTPYTTRRKLAARKAG